jgi:hypothetical protein
MLELIMLFGEGSRFSVVTAGIVEWALEGRYHRAYSSCPAPRCTTNGPKSELTQSIRNSTYARSEYRYTKILIENRNIEEAHKK